jgi:hypothetical protein
LIDARLSGICPDPNLGRLRGDSDPGYVWMTIDVHGQNAARIKADIAATLEAVVKHAMHKVAGLN